MPITGRKSKRFERMTYQKIVLPARPIPDAQAERFIPSITTYILNNSDEVNRFRRRPMVVICPGGAYRWKSFRESEPVAMRMLSLGFNACILDYSVAPMDFPAAFMDVAEAVYYVRTHADELNSDPNKIAVCGFSAGGHLAASLGVWWNSDFVGTYLPYSHEDIKPNVLLLSYPVISSGKHAHQGSIANLLGDNFGKASYMELVSLEKHVSKDVPPTFIWCTADDDCVPVQNTLLFTSALAECGVLFESHIFRSGVHGLSLATEETAGEPEQVQADVAVWPELFKKFMQGIF